MNKRKSSLLAKVTPVTDLNTSVYLPRTQIDKFKRAFTEEYGAKGKKEWLAATVEVFVQLQHRVDLATIEDITGFNSKNTKREGVRLSRKTVEHLERLEVEVRQKKPKSTITRDGILRQIIQWGIKQQYGIEPGDQH